MTFVMGASSGKLLSFCKLDLLAAGKMCNVAKNNENSNRTTSIKKKENLTVKKMYQLTSNVTADGFEVKRSTTQ